MAAQLQDKVAIVTGSSSGIGEAIAIAFASKGAKVIVCGRDQERLNAVIGRVVKASGGHKDRFITVPGDLTDSKFRKELIDKTVSKFGRLDVLVANAGISSLNQTVHTVTEETYNEILDTNLKSVLFLIKEAVPHLEKTKGNIITISSNLTSFVIPSMTVYAVSKAALDHLTDCLAVDLGAKGVRVNGIHPGYIPTKLGRFLPDAVVEKLKDNMGKMNMAQQPLKERELNVNDIAEATAFLASDAAGCVTGEHVRVDGGRSYGGGFDPSSLGLKL